MLGIEFDELSSSDLFLDAFYKSDDSARNAGNDPIYKLLGVSNMGWLYSASGRRTPDRADIEQSFGCGRGRL
jgi:hypothetical protein